MPTAALSFITPVNSFGRGMAPTTNTRVIIDVNQSLNCFTWSNYEKDICSAVDEAFQQTMALIANRGLPADGRYDYSVFECASHAIDFGPESIGAAAGGWR